MNRTVLLVEDDAIAREVLARHLRALDWQTLEAATLADARHLIATRGPIDAAIVDLDLPDGDGTTLLDASARLFGLALASSAEWSREKMARARAAGFDGTVAKPCSRDDLATVMAQAAVPPGEGMPIFDDRAALRALGTPSAVLALRSLLADELPMYRQRLLAHVAESDQAGLRAQLHRLLSAAGFTGAAALKEATVAYQVDGSPARLQQILVEIDRCLLAVPAKKSFS